MLTTLLPGFAETTVATGLSGPTAMDFSPDGRLWVLEQSGNVKYVKTDGSTFTALHLGTGAVDSAGERGVLGIAFDQNYLTNHFVYVYYTNPNAGGASWATGEHNQLSRFTVTETVAGQPTFTAEAPILDWNNLSTATNHNGGAIHFGKDGMLYADAGDNVQTFTASDGHSYRVSQSMTTLLGKQLRIDVSKFNSGVATRDDVAVGHLIPADNPFVGTATGINQLIYVLGLRNPFSFAVQPGTGRILINDVGEVTWEEIDDSIAGGNYGWSGGNTDGFGHAPPAFATGVYHDPLLAYAHSGTASLATGSAIVGSTFYNPATVQFPDSYIGMYFYEDLSSGFIRYFNPNTPNVAATPDGNSVAFASGTPGGLRDLLVDSAGNLYYLSGGDGSIRKISYVAPKITSQPLNQTVALDQTANFLVAANGTGLSYQWQHLIGGTWTNVGTNSASLSVTNVQAGDAGSYRVIVTNTNGSQTSTTAQLIVQPAIALTGLFDTPNFATSWYNSGAVPIENNVLASITAVQNLQSLTVALPSFHTGDVLTVPKLTGVSLVTSYSAGTLTLSGSDSVAHYQQELRYISYNNTIGPFGVASVPAVFVANDGISSSTPVTATINFSVAAGQVLGNRLFYNNSKYDGGAGAGNAAINANDDLAIASDKTGYRGTGTATFANVTAFSKGITGIMVDLQSGIGAHSAINLTSGDVTFKVAPAVFVTTTYNQLSTWTPAPTPTAISVRLGAGMGGSDRLEITWASGAIKNTWLEVDVHAGGNTGLSADDVFYFGSAAGNAGVGDTASLSKVDVSDYVSANNNIIGLTTPVWNLTDYTKDGKVDVTDSNVVLNGIFTLHYLASPTGPFAPDSGSGPATPAAVSTQQDAGGAIASGLSFLNSGSGALSAGFANRLQGILNSPSTARFVERIERSPQLLQAIDQIASTFHVHDDAIRDLLAELTGSTG